jgi:hypothetical protein
MTVYCKRFHCVTPNTARRSFGNVNALSRQGVGSTEGGSTLITLWTVCYDRRIVKKAVELLAS